VGPWLVAIGLVVALAGALVWAGVPLGRLPGDLVIRRGNVTMYFPITTSIVVSVVLSVLAMVLRR
jgi:Protein of unknown function (DUF2905)